MKFSSTVLVIFAIASGALASSVTSAENTAGNAAIADPGYYPQYAEGVDPQMVEEARHRGGGRWDYGGRYDRGRRGRWEYGWGYERGGRYRHH